jgi:hypothetical protein
MNIVNPARLDSFQGNNVCIQCHSQGRPRTSPIQGKYYDWPVGFHVGLDLKNFWQLEEHKPGEQSFFPCPLSCSYPLEKTTEAPVSTPPSTVRRRCIT